MTDEGWGRTSVREEVLPRRIDQIPQHSRSAKLYDYSISKKNADAEQEKLEANDLIRHTPQPPLRL